MSHGGGGGAGERGAGRAEAAGAHAAVAGRWRDEGRLPRLDAVASAVGSVVADGPAAGARALDLRVLGGVDVRVLPDRGLDLGAAWFGGWPLAWTSSVGEAAPPVAHDPAGTGWLRAFGGGLLTTCGLRNVGAPSEGHGLHGEISLRRASGVAVTRSVDPDGEVALSVTGVVEEAEALGVRLQLTRTITTWTGRGRLGVDDEVVNLGTAVEPAPVLYHVNLGPALWDEGAELTLASRRALPRDGQDVVWHVPPAPRPAAPELVWEHELPADPEGWAEAVVRNPRTGLVLRLAWHTDALPRFHQWVHPAAQVWALGLEPANCSTRGRAHDRAEGRLPTLAPGERRRTALRLHIADGGSA